MNEELRIDYYFNQIARIPHGSYHEEAIANYVENFAKEQGLRYIRDNLNNIVIYKDATAGYENHETVMLQGHMDMVNEKNHTSSHDFSKDPLDLYVEDGFLHAKGTTLGADDGVAVCYMLAILEDNSLKHPALECTFTVQEEVGLIGAMNLKADYFKAKKMIGLDCGSENEVTVSCSGGRRCAINKPIHRIYNELPCYKIVVENLHGGHSGGVIHKEYANANKLINRIYYHLMINYVDIRLVNFGGGLKDNAIPRECASTFASSTPLHQIEKIVADAANDIMNEYSESEENMNIFVTAGKFKNYSISAQESYDIIKMLYLAPNGFQRKSYAMDLTIQSLNMGVVTLKEDIFEARFSIRSPMESAKNELSYQLREIAQLFNAYYSMDSSYPGWAYDPNSQFRKQYKEFVKETEGVDITENATHGGLETGIILGMLPGLDIITMGPNMYDIHSPAERMEIASYHRVYQRLVKFLETL